jgi:hypothetical protein
MNAKGEASEPLHARSADGAFADGGSTVATQLVLQFLVSGIAALVWGDLAGCRLAYRELSLNGSTVFAAPAFDPEELAGDMIDKPFMTHAQQFDGLSLFPGVTDQSLLVEQAQGSCAKYCLTFIGRSISSELHWAEFGSGMTNLYKQFSGRNTRIVGDQCFGWLARPQKFFWLFKTGS